MKVFFGVLGLLLLSVAASLAAGEYLVRTVYPEYGFAVEKVNLFSEFHPVLGWRLIPNFRGTHVFDEYRVIERINSKGIRGPEYPYGKEDGEFRILILGDSMAEGFNVAFEDVFSEVLDRRLNRKFDRPVEVINTGVGGYSTDQELLFFQTEGKQYNPDLTILVFLPSNDLKYNLEDRYWLGKKPLFAIENGEAVLKSTPQTNHPPSKFGDATLMAETPNQPFELRNPRAGTCGVS